MKVVINRCYGGFGVSTAAVLAMRERGSEWAKQEVLKGEAYPDGRIEDFDYNSHSYGLSRNDADLIAVVEAMGKEADGEHADLRIVEIPDGVEFEIDDYDGMESIHEAHRSWP